PGALRPRGGGCVRRAGSLGASLGCSGLFSRASRSQYARYGRQTDVRSHSTNQSTSSSADLQRLQRQRSSQPVSGRGRERLRAKAVSGSNAFAEGLRCFESRLAQSIMSSSEIDPITTEVLHRAVHDLKGPTNRLRILAELLGRSEAILDEDSRKLLSHIRDSAAEINGVAEGLRTFAEVCTRSLNLETIDLNEVFTVALGKLRQAVDESGTRIDCSH